MGGESVKFSDGRRDQTAENCMNVYYLCILRVAVGFLYITDEDP
jgi:hypothetical protein